MSQTKISLFEMAEAVGDTAFSARGHVERWNRDHPDDPLPPDNPWVKEVRIYETAHVTLSLMALDEEASRSSSARSSRARTARPRCLMAMIANDTPIKPKKQAA